MVGGVNNNDLVRLSQELASKLDAKDGKADGKISKSVWDEFATAHGGKTINYSITTENAEKSIRTYARRETLQGAANKVAEWLGMSPQDNSTPVSVPETAPQSGISADNMKTHNEKVDRLEQEADKVIQRYAGDKILSLNLNGITADNLPYILKKEPDFFEKLLSNGDLRRNNVEDEIIKLYDKLSGKQLVENPTTFNEALQGLKEMANKSGVQSKYTAEDINTAVDRDRAAQKETLSGYVTYPPVKTEETDRVNGTKEKAEALKSELKDLFNNDLDFDKYIAKLNEADKDVLAYILEDSEIRSQIDQQMDKRQIKVLLRLLGCTEEDIKHLNKKGCTKLLNETASDIRQADKKKIDDEANVKKQNEAKAIVDNAIEVLVQMANTKAGCKVEKTEANNASTYTYIDEENEVCNRIVISKNPPMVKIGDNFEIKGGSVYADGVKLEGADAGKFMAYINKMIAD